MILLNNIENKLSQGRNALPKLCFWIGLLLLVLWCTTRVCEHDEN